MSVILKDSESYAADVLYETRGVYKEHATKYLGNVQKQAVKDARVDTPYYGRLHKGIVYFPNEKYLVEIANKNVSFMFVQDFVHEAFKDFDAYYTKARLTRRIKTTGPLSTLQPFKSYISPSNQYDNHLNRLKTLFLDYIDVFHKDKKIDSPRDLAALFLLLLAERKGEIYFSKEKYMLSNYCDPFTSGLSISIGNFDHNNDLAKYTSIISDPNFSFFVEGTRRFGFFLDMQTPWVLHFDFQSPISQEKYLKANKARPSLQNNLKLKSEDIFYKELCIPTYAAAVQNLKTFIYICYSALVGDIKRSNTSYAVPSGITECNAINIEIRNRETVTQADLQQDNDIDYWLKMYYKVRKFEEAAMVPASQEQKFLVDMATVNRYSSRQEADVASITKTINLFLEKNREKTRLEKAKTF
jgi:hypothetical protein